ncbi:tRNA pseudouridine(13) synthase TruD [Candidatus Woesearchaeota archaeon]|jgi:tRNA(Glu) U13 pseudouridine synthase TruD|nr:tRNA pseudouridine(13) synthase TruD [Candidatus Woesearchaeota archaeon]MBT5215257.1 tRNA pseudouridine(13) synthase TruD [Candidatus Woesearchaeota archaeon]
MKIKVVEEDFKVDEVANLNLKNFNEISGQPYGIFLLTKKGRNTPEIISEIARRLRIKTRFIGFAGNKDKKAVTKQYISIPLDSENEINQIIGFESKDVMFSFVGWSENRITLGDLKGNKFEIVVRGLENERDLQVENVKNFFGEQRFGTINVEVGRAIVKKEFEKACNLLGLDVEGRNFVNSLRSLDARQLRFYVSAYQSWMWNQVAKKVNSVENVELLGFLTDFENKDVGKLYEGILSKEDIAKENFMIKQIKEASLEGTKRKLFMDVSNFSFVWGEDEILDNKKKCTLSFELNKGCYATVLVDFLFGPTWKSI